MKLNVWIGMIAFSVISAQSSIPGNRWINLQFRDWEGHFTGDFQSRERQLVGAEFNGQSHRRAFFEEIRFGGDGHIYHPNLYQFAFNVALGLNQSAITRAGETDPYSKDAGFVRDVIYQSIILPKKPYNVLLAFNRKYRRLNNNFFEDVESYTKRWTTRSSWRNKSMSIQGGLSSDNREEYFGDRQIRVEEKRLDLTGNWGDRKSLNGSFRGGYTHSLREDVGLYSSDQRNTMIQTNVIYPFNEIGTKAVSTSLMYNSILSTDDILNVTWNVGGRTTLPRRITTSGQYSFQYYQNGNSITRNHTWQANVSHALYESLFSTADLNLNYFIEDTYQRSEFQFPLKTNYRKNLPVGRLTMNFGWQPNQEFIISENGTILDASQPHNFGDQLTLLLSTENILEESITVTSLDELILYTRDVDFLVQPYGSGFEISRIPGSAIPDSVTVLVHYSVLGKPTQQTHYTFWTYGIGYSYQSYWGLIMGFTGSSSRYPESQFEGFSTQDEKHDETWFLNIDYSPFNLEIKQERSDSKLTPYTVTSVSLNGILGSFLSQYLMVSTDYSWQDLPLRDDHQEIQNLVLEGFRRFSRSIRGKISWGRRSINGTLNDLVEEKWLAVVKYETRKTAISLNYSWSRNTLMSDRELDKKMFLEINVKP